VIDFYILKLELLNEKLLLLLLLLLLLMLSKLFSLKFATGSAPLRPNLVSIRGCCAANVIVTKLKSSNLQGKLIQFIVFTIFVIIHSDSIKDLEFFLVELI